ncbi:MAG: PLP-dependent aminotransferase family protein [Hyphomicrobiales bacterium]
MTLSIDRSSLTEKTPKRRPYLALLDSIRSDVESGRLQPGEKLPTQRELAKRLGLAVGTVTKAYSEAAKQGLISTEVGRGTFVLGLAHGATGRAPFDLTFNRVAYEDAHAAEIAADLGRLLRRVTRPGAFDYNPSADSREHREHGAQWLRGMGVDAGADRVLICNSVQHGLSLILQSLARPGSLVLTEQLGYPGIGLLESVLGFQLRGLAMDSHGLTVETLKQACEREPARILVCAPTLHNPTNGILPMQRRVELAEFARSRDLTIIEYDVNGIPPDDPLPSFTVLAPERSYLLTGTWKATPMGAGLGYIVAPAESAERLTAVVQATTWTPSPLLRQIVTNWIADGTAARAIDWHKREVTKRLAVVRPMLEGFDYHWHPASYHIWLTLPAPWRREIFVEALRGVGIAVSPADVFIVGRSIAPHAVRLALGGISDLSSLGKAAATIVDTLRKGPQPRIVTA